MIAARSNYRPEGDQREAIPLEEARARAQAFLELMRTRRSIRHFSVRAGAA